MPDHRASPRPAPASPSPGEAGCGAPPPASARPRGRGARRIPWLAAALAVLAAAPAARAEPVGVAQPTDMHRFPGRIFAVVATLAPGQVAERAECNASATWCRIVLPGGAEGWVPAETLGPPGAGAVLPEGVAPGALPDDGPVEVTVLAEVNVREAPGADQPLVGQLPAGATAIRESCDEAGEWCSLTSGDLTGWVAAGYLLVSGPLADPPEDGPPAAGTMLADLPPPADRTAPDPAIDRAVVTSPVNVRAGPGNDHPVLGTLDGGDEVVRVGCTDPLYWCEVSAGDLTGWVFHDFLADHAPRPLPDLPPPE